MSEFTDGYTPTKIEQGLSVWSDSATPNIVEHVIVTADVGNHPEATKAAVQAAAAAVKASLEASFPGHAVDDQGTSLYGGKGLAA
jgi:hypothetical protein